MSVTSCWVLLDRMFACMLLISLKNIFPIQVSLFILPWKEICNHNHYLRWNIKDITSCWPSVLNGNSNLLNKYSSFCQKFLIHNESLFRLEYMLNHTIWHDDIDSRCWKRFKSKTLNNESFSRQCLISRIFAGCYDGNVTLQVSNF